MSRGAIQRGSIRRSGNGARLLARRRKLCFEALEPRALLSVAPVGGEFRVNTDTTGAQSLAAVAMDADGDFVVVWNSGGDVHAQRYNAAGVSQGSEFQVNTFTTGSQGVPSVAMDADGDFVVVWQSFAQDGSDGGVYAQRYDAAGVAQGAEFRVNSYTTDDQQEASVAMDANGDFVVTWICRGQDGVYAQRYNAAGIAQGSEFRVNTSTTSGGRFPVVALDADGDFVVAWMTYRQDDDDDGWGVYAQRYDATGVAQGIEFRVNTFTYDFQVLPSVAMAADGDFVIAWESDHSIHDGVYAQRYSAAGVPQGTEFRVNTHFMGGKVDPSIAMNADGDFVVAWQSGYASGIGQDGSEWGIYAQRYNAAGVPQGSEFRVNSYTTGDQEAPSVALSAAGDFTVVWQSRLQDGDSWGVYAQRYEAGVFGDFDEDGDEDADDIDILWHIVRGNGSDPNGDDSGDLDGSGLVNEDDTDYMIQQIVGPNQRTRYGDADLDGDVDGADFDAWRLRDSLGGGIGWATGDFDGDGDVDGADLDLWRTRAAQYPGSVGTHALSAFTLATSETIPGLPAGASGEGTTELAEHGVTRPAVRVMNSASAGAADTTSLVKHDLSIEAASPLYRSRHLRWMSVVDPAALDLLAVSW